MQPPNTRYLRDALPEIQDGDLLLFRRRRSPIARLGRGLYCHAAMVIWTHGLPMIAEMRWSGGRLVTLESQVIRYPARVDHYAANATANTAWSPHRAVRHMLRTAGRPYNWLGILAAVARRLPGLRLILPPDIDDSATNRRPLFCSQAVAWASRAAGVDPVPNLADRATEPCDLARSTFYAYRCTLV